jgi:predicted transposase/invertase (TIGR01784 family)
MRFVDPKNDVAFRKIFGDSRKTEILISFLNAVLELPSPIASLTIASPSQTPRIEGLKDTVLDVKATDHNGREFIVEMQVEGNEMFGKRALYYAAKSYVSQIKKAERYSELKPVYFVGILDFNLFDGDDYITRHIIINQQSGNQDLRDIELNFIELRKFNKTEAQLQSISDKWIYFIKNAENLQIIPEVMTEPEIKEAFETAEQHNWSEEDMYVYDYWSGKKGDELCQLITAEKKGIQKGLQKGIQKGRAEGEKQKAIKVAITAIKRGMEARLIAELTGLTTAEIEELQRDINS